MKPQRLVVLSTCLLLASGALFFACSDAGTGSDGGTDAGSRKDATADSAKDSTTDAPNLSDSSSNDGSSSDGSSDATGDGSDGATVDAGPATTFMVVRVGGEIDGGGISSLNNASTQVFLEERNISDGMLVRTIAMPTTVSGSNQPLSVSGSATSEGSLTTSTDGKYVVMAGYATGPGLTGVASTSVFDGGTLRVVARVDHGGNVNTSTELAAFDMSNIRGAVSGNGASFWASGTAAADSGLGGIQYVLLSSTGATTQITNVPSNTRVANIFNGQLYLSSAITPQNGISAVGNNLPTTSGQTSTLLPGFAGDSGSPYGFSMLDLDASVSGLDTLYVADDSTQANGGGLQKWVFDGNGWTKVATFKDGTTGGFRGLMAVASGSGVIVIATTTATNANSIIKYVDDGTSANPTGTVLATAATNTVYRGIALAPQ